MLSGVASVQVVPDGTELAAILIEFGDNEIVKHPGRKHTGHIRLCGDVGLGRPERHPACCSVPEIVPISDEIPQRESGSSKVPRTLDDRFPHPVRAIEEIHQKGLRTHVHGEEVVCREYAGLPNKEVVLSRSLNHGQIRGSMLSHPWVLRDVAERPGFIEVDGERVEPDRIHAEMRPSSKRHDPAGHQKERGHGLATPPGILQLGECALDEPAGIQPAVLGCCGQVRLGGIPAAGRQHGYARPVEDTSFPQGRKPLACFRPIRFVFHELGTPGSRQHRRLYRPVQRGRNRGDLRGPVSREFGSRSYPPGIGRGELLEQNGHTSWGAANAIRQPLPSMCL